MPCFRFELTCISVRVERRGIEVRKRRSAAFTSRTRSVTIVTGTMPAPVQPEAAVFNRRVFERANQNGQGGTGSGRRVKVLSSVSSTTP